MQDARTWQIRRCSNLNLKLQSSALKSRQRPSISSSAIAGSQPRRISRWCARTCRAPTLKRMQTRSTVCSSSVAWLSSRISSSRSSRPTTISKRACRHRPRFMVRRNARCVIRLHTSAPCRARLQRCCVLHLPRSSSAAGACTAKTWQSNARSTRSSPRYDARSSRSKNAVSNLADSSSSSKTLPWLWEAMRTTAI